MLCEIVLLGFIARNLYKSEIPDLTITQPPIITTHITTLSARVHNEANNNNNNNNNDLNTHKNDIELYGDTSIVEKL